MGNRNPKFDLYIAKAAPFAQPVLKHVRELVHKACPQAEETFKWGFPHFEYKGMLCHTAALKEHCVFGFWKGSIMKDPQRLIERTAMGQFGRITSLSDLPDDKILLSYLKEAVKLNDENVKLPHRNKSEGTSLTVPSYFLKEIKKNKAAMKTFDGFSHSNKKEYVEWIEEAKTEATREKRMQTALEWMAEGKIRNWKYVKK